MKIKIHSKEPSQITADLLVVPAASSAEFKPSEFEGLPKLLLERIKNLAVKRKIKFETGETLVIESPQGFKAEAVLVAGMGKLEDMSGYKLRTLAANILKQAESRKAATIAFMALKKQIPKEGAENCYNLIMGALLSSYRFDKYFGSEKKSKFFSPEEFEIVFSSKSDLPKNAAAIISRAQVVAEGVINTRDIVNEPGSALYPEKLAQLARKLAAKSGNLKVTVWDEKRLLKERMNLIYEVGRGAQNKPRLIVMEYSPSKAKKGGRKVILVGKGLTFDTGGVNLKPASGGMLEVMKLDKGGGAAVIGAMSAIARLKPDFTVIGLIPSAQNSIGGNAYLPGDVITGRKGISVEVNNTDAEGRLILADALAYGSELKPTEMIDCATLTGACMVALGMHTSGLFTPNDELATLIEEASARASEHVWRLPLTEKLAEGLKSNIGDTKNSGGRFGGAISAAHFLKKFVDASVKWAHIDIAGPAFTESGYDYFSYGGTGVIAETLIEFVAPRKI